MGNGVIAAVVLLVACKGDKSSESTPPRPLRRRAPAVQFFDQAGQLIETADCKKVRCFK